MAAAADLPHTKARLIAAATELFAARGFHATTVRDIAGRARVNVASGNYHYGSKKALYVEVLRDQFAGIRSMLRRRGASVAPTALAGLARPALEKLLLARVQAMLELLLGPPPAPHAALMQREMCDPSEALPVIVNEFIVPMVDEMAEIVAHLAPGLDRRAVERSVYSIAGQALFYQVVQPAMLFKHGWKAYPRGFTRKIAAHITRFSLGGLDRLARSAARRSHAR